jgi:hypothetical protein
VISTNPAVIPSFTVMANNRKFTPRTAIIHKRFRVPAVASPVRVRLEIPFPQGRRRRGYSKARPGCPENAAGPLLRLWVSPPAPAMAPRLKRPAFKSTVHVMRRPKGRERQTATLFDWSKVRNATIYKFVLSCPPGSRNCRRRLVEWPIGSRMSLNHRDLPFIDRPSSSFRVRWSVRACNPLGCGLRARTTLIVKMVRFMR